MFLQWAQGVHCQTKPGFLSPCVFGRCAGFVQESIWTLPHKELEARGLFTHKSQTKRSRALMQKEKKTVLSLSLSFFFFFSFLWQLLMLFLRPHHEVGLLLETHAFSVFLTPGFCTASFPIYPFLYSANTTETLSFHLDVWSQCKPKRKNPVPRMRVCKGKVAFDTGGNHKTVHMLIIGQRTWHDSTLINPSL